MRPRGPPAEVQAGRRRTEGARTSQVPFEGLSFGFRAFRVSDLGLGFLGVPFEGLRVGFIGLLRFRIWVYRAFQVSDLGLGLL